MTRVIGIVVSLYCADTLVSYRGTNVVLERDWLMGLNTSTPVVYVYKQEHRTIRWLLGSVLQVTC